MNSEIIKDKFGNQSMWSDPKWSGAWDKFKEEQTSEIDDTNKPWRYDIPMNELDLNDKIVHSPNFKYKGSSHEVYMRKAPLQRIGELRKNFSSVSDNNEIKKQLEQHINDNFTHVYQVIEQRHDAIIAGRVMNEITYIVRGSRIGY
jgi:hypothetical protein